MHTATLRDMNTAGAGLWRFLSLPVYRLIAVYSRDPDRRRCALEVLRLASPNAASIKSYLDDPAQDEASDQLAVTRSPAEPRSRATAAR